MQNIVLIGMSGCGKTTLGKLLSRETDRLFIDTDEQIRLMGYDIKTVFAQQGERYFREIEYTACQQAVLHRECVIATGGGVVTQPCTMEVLSENNFVVYIKRDIEKIIMSANHQSRPLFTSDAAVRQLFEARRSLYEKYAHFVLENNESLQTALKRLSVVLRARGL